MSRVAALTTLVILAITLAACRATGDEPLAATESPPPPTDAASSAAMSIPLCADVPQVKAPAELYGDSPIYVANEMPAEEVRAWASRKPGFEEIWIDRNHGGWITVAFSTDAEARQAELAEAFPDVGAVAVEVDWTMPELTDLQRRIGDELPEASSTIFVKQGVVGIGIGVLDPERIAEIEGRFGDERICVEGIPPDQAPADGPQQLAGDGWRLLANEQGVGEPFRTSVASDDDSYGELWERIGLTAERPPVDFESEIVIWFGAVYGSNCPELRLDDVVVELERALVHAEIVLVGGLRACNGDANPRAYVVALERSQPPSGPFAIQLDANGPPPGAPEERTIVEADLSVPGAVARPDQVHAGPLAAASEHPRVRSDHRGRLPGDVRVLDALRHRVAGRDQRGPLADGRDRHPGRMGVRRGRRGIPRRRGPARGRSRADADGHRERPLGHLPADPRGSTRLRLSVSRSL